MSTFVQNLQALWAGEESRAHLVTIAVALVGLGVNLNYFLG